MEVDNKFASDLLYNKLTQPRQLKAIKTRNQMKNRQTLKEKSEKLTAKNVAFYKSGDAQLQPYKLAISKRRFRTFDALLEALSDRIPLPFGVRSIYTPRGRHGIRDVEEFEDGKSYICSDRRKHVTKPIDFSSTSKIRPPWFINKASGSSNASALGDFPKMKLPPMVQVKTPKKVVLVRNGEPNNRQSLLLSRRTCQNFENILKDIRDMFGTNIQKIFTIDGVKIETLQCLLMENVTNIFVVALHQEAFAPMEYRIRKITNKQKNNNKTITNSDTNMQQSSPAEICDDDDGEWEVSVVTSELPAAGTKSQVAITIFGTVANSGVILLSQQNQHEIFQCGNEDKFLIKLGDIGDLLKIRLEHDNSGVSPGWLCESLTLMERRTHTSLFFPCNRWLSRDEEDGEICREFAVALPPNRKSLAIASYRVELTTGDLWNGGTSTPVYLTLIGQNGDSGARMVQQHGKPPNMMKGSTFTYKFEAINLGDLHRMVIGHYNQQEGEGWYLERAIVTEEETNKIWTFECDRWMDTSQDDGKIIRELFPENQHSHNNKLKPSKEKSEKMWQLEKWKYQRGNRIVFINHTTKLALRIRQDGSVDGLGNPTSLESGFQVIRRRGMIRVFSNLAHRSFHLAVDQNRLLGEDRGGGPFCEFEVRVQPDRSVILESGKYPGQYVTVDQSGKSADTRGQPRLPSRRFSVHVKGCFRHQSIVQLNTSPTQTLTVTSSGQVVGTGTCQSDRNKDEMERTVVKISPCWKFNVVKVEPQIRMFQLLSDPRKFLRIKDGVCDGWGVGDVHCQFRITKHHLSGHVTLQSVKHRQVAIGLDARGKAKPMKLDSNNSIRFYPRVIAFGTDKSSTAANNWEIPAIERIVTSPLNGDVAVAAVTEERGGKLLPPVGDRDVVDLIVVNEREKSPEIGIRDGEYRLFITTGQIGTTHEVTLHVYGDDGTSGPIILGRGHVTFERGKCDEFLIILKKIGKIRKIRIGVEETDGDFEWKLKKVKLKNMRTNEVFLFNFNRWLSRKREDGATVRELPAKDEYGEDCLRVVNYIITVKTSKESKYPNTNNNKNNNKNNKQQQFPQLYIRLFGSHGDSGRRLLTVTSAQQDKKFMFRPGKVNEFMLEAVSLGKLRKCQISNSKQQQSETSCEVLFDEVVISQSDDPKQQVCFACNKWLGVNCTNNSMKPTLTLQNPRIRTQENAKDAAKTEKSKKEKDKTPTGSDWCISVVTGTQPDAGTSSNVMFCAYDVTQRMFGPLLLGRGSDGFFRSATIEKFKVRMEGFGEISKVRFWHDCSGTSPSWFVERVKMKSLMTSSVTPSSGGGKRSLDLNVMKWVGLARKPYQTAIEVPLPVRGRRELPRIFLYHVRVFTGSLLGSDTEANVYVTIYGGNGDSGRRVLHKSLNNSNKFLESQMDIFEIEAVDLGELTKIEIGHDGVGHGNGWFLHKVIIKEHQNSTRDYVFFCNRWLDDGQDDGLIERVIEVKPLDEDTQAIVHKSKDGIYKVFITLSPLSPTNNREISSGLQLSLVVYGYEGKSQPCLLLPRKHNNDGTDEDLLPGTTSIFQIYLADLGEIYKLRIAAENFAAEWKGILIDDVTMECSANRKLFPFPSRRWLSPRQGDFSTTREIPLRGDDPVLPVCKYEVVLTTGVRCGAATDANLFVTLKGSRGDSGERRVDERFDFFAFAEGRTMRCSIESVDLSEVDDITIRHDGIGYGAGLFIEHLHMKQLRCCDGDDSDDVSTTSRVYESRVWMDDHVGDGKLERTFHLIGTRDDDDCDCDVIKRVITSSQRQHDPRSDLAAIYQVHVSVDEITTEANASVQLRGVLFHPSGVASEPFSLGEWRPGRAKDFVFAVDAGDVTEIAKLRVWIETTSGQQEEREMNLFLLHIRFVNQASGRVHHFRFNRRFSTATGSTVKELPVFDSFLPAGFRVEVLEYFVSMKISPSEIYKLRHNGMMQMNLVGSGGDSGWRTLIHNLNVYNTINNNNNKQFDDGFLFELEAVGIGKLERIEIRITQPRNQQGLQMKITDIAIMSRGPPNSSANISVLRSFYRCVPDDDDDDVTVTSQHVTSLRLEYQFRPESPNSNFLRLIDETAGEIPPSESDGNWRLTLTFDGAEIGDNPEVEINIFGDKGRFCDRKRLENDGKLKLSSEYAVKYCDVSFNPEEIGKELSRLGLKFNSKPNLCKVKLKDSDNGQQFLIYVTPETDYDVICDDEVSGCVGFYFYLVKPDQFGEFPQTVQVQTRTGKHPAGGNRANKKITIKYANEDDVTIELNEANNLEGRTGNQLFRPSGVNKFVMTSSSLVDAGPPQKVVISHDDVTNGMGSGWLLNDVIIAQKAADNVTLQYVFACNRWLDGGFGDGLVERELCLFGIAKRQQTNNNNNKTNGSYKCSINYSKESTQSTFTYQLAFCFRGHDQYDVTIRKFKEKQIDDVFVDLSDFDEELIKILLQILPNNNNDDDVTMTSWPFEQILLENMETLEELIFVCDTPTTTTVSMETTEVDDVREFPVIRYDQPYLAVRPYYVTMKPATWSSESIDVKIELLGHESSTGKRRIPKNQKMENFRIDAVNLGETIDHVIVTLDCTSQDDDIRGENLDSIKICAGFDPTEHQLFTFNKKMPRGETTLSRSTVQCLAVPGLDQSATTFAVRLTCSSGSDDVIMERMRVKLIGNDEVEGGKLKLRNSLDEGDEDLTEFGCEIGVKSNFGVLRKLRVGFDAPNFANSESVVVVLENVEVRNLKLKHCYSFDVKHSFHGNDAATSGWNFTEFAAVLPCHPTIPENTELGIEIHGGSGSYQHIYINVFGNTGDTGKRVLSSTLEGDMKYKFTCIDIEQPKKILLGFVAKDKKSKFSFHDVTVTSAAIEGKRFVFEKKKRSFGKTKNGMGEIILDQCVVVEQDEQEDVV